MLTNLALSRPIIFFDTETTGTDSTKDRIVEISTCKISTDSTSEFKTRRFNPGMPIPPEATLIHGITDEDVKNEPPFSSLAKGISAYFTGCDVAGYNSIRFDVPILVQELLNAGAPVPFNSETKFLDAMRIFHLKEKRDLSAALKFYCNKDHSQAHSAVADVKATIEVLNAQISRYQLKNSVSELHELSNENNSVVDYDRKFIRNPDGAIIYNFGPHFGKTVFAEVGFLNWMLTKDFSIHTKYCATRILSGHLK